ncbi:hypothetical protein BBD42_07015 [Paenibacillus sp. BIHB 4019]|uniref:Uncharacterized protein n=1 Tax=Paenibacillus sp. BIHB 4019 TaxID=1870819 RepID=A0A1B2DEU4_9BACL|nr:hypothetical protein [Paenibacillus sp. BIHB 4019]ANY66242.1 hypothetical protein BBD42_07015 [Paenibacillus sp. BIHB 4019]
MMPIDKQNERKKNAALQQLPEQPISQWRNWLLQCLEPLAALTRNSDYAGRAAELIKQSRPVFSPAMKCLFELHSFLFIMEQLHTGTFVGYHTRVAMEDVQGSINKLFEQSPALADAEPAFWDRLAETLADLRGRLLAEERYADYFSPVYYALWRKWLYPRLPGSPLLAEELEHLEALKPQQKIAQTRYQWMFAKCWLSFLLGRDEEAQALLTALGRKSKLRIHDYYALLDELEQRKEWDRLLHWLKQTASLLADHHGVHLNAFFAYWDAVLAEMPQEEEAMWEQLLLLLPASRSIYADKLHHYEKWQEWIDYQLSEGIDPLYYRVAMFAPIEKHAPELLLPFYHQAAERYVLLKNRDGYKSAVKLLKRLAKLYKKRKDEAGWETFITAFAGRYSRLRALQEELRKGKLLS